MGKMDLLTPKAVAHRVKSRGPQKLRWYCQMCRKQCRDQNGFDRHCLSESHQRRLLVVSENPQQYVDRFSEEFRNDFLELLRRRFGTKRVHNNVVYNEYIARREHVHMNATQWETLTDFTEWLRREGYCRVEETPKGMYIQYIDRDPETVCGKKKPKPRLDEEEKRAAFVAEQVRRGLEGKELEEPLYTELNRDNGGEKVVFNLNKGSSKAKGGECVVSSKASAAVKRKETSNSGEPKGKKKKSALDESEEGKKKSTHWLQPEIVVKIITKKLGEKYHKKKAVVEEVIGQYTAIGKVVDSGDELRLDQTHLETVIPAPGKKVLVLNGNLRGCEATLEGISEQTFSAIIIIESGPLKGRRVEGVPYEDISKLV